MKLMIIEFEYELTCRDMLPHNSGHVRLSRFT